MNEEQQKIETKLIVAYPDKYLNKFIKTAEDIIKYKSFLNDFSFDKKNTNYFLKILINYVLNDNGKKKRQVFRLLRRITRNSEYNELTKTNIDNLFKINKKFRGENDENNQILSVTLKNQILEKEQIKWLINNSESPDLLNRILYYPEKSELISDWCLKKLLERNDLDNREAEFIARALEKKDLSFFIKKKICTTILCKAIFYSKFKDKEKEEKLISLLNVDYRNETITGIAYKLNLYKVIELQYKKYLLKN